jgi:hypothetical protein
LSLTEAPEVVARGVADLKAISTERLAALRENAGGKAKPEAAKTEESAKVIKPAGGSAETGSAKKGPAEKPGSHDKASETVATADFSFVPKEFVSEVEKLSPEFQAFLKKEEREGNLRWGDYTKKTTAIKATQADLDAKKDLLAFGEAVERDPEAMAALRALHAKRTGKAEPAAPKPFKVTEEHTEEEWQEYLDGIRKKAVDDALTAVRSERSNETKEQTEKREVSEAVFNKFVQPDGRTAEEVNAFWMKLGDWKGVRALLRAKGVEFSAENVVATLADLLPAKIAAVKEAAKDSPGGNGPVAHAANGASVLGRNGANLAPLRVPQVILDGKTPSSREERLSVALHKVNASRVARGLPPITND